MSEYQVCNPNQFDICFVMSFDGKNEAICIGAIINELAKITGITLAYLLNKQGLSVILLERDKVCNRCYCKHHTEN